MKSAARILSLVILAGLSSFYIACDEGGGKSKSETDQQIEKLNGTWDATTVTLDGVAPPIDQSDFQLTINGSAGNTVINFVTVRPTGLSPWPPSGTLEFDEASPTTTLVRNDGGGETVTISYSVSETTLSMDFLFSGDPFPSGRTKNVNGTWHYEFAKL
jgi:hypothetical protein